jgi:hypothetical protein
LSIVYSSGVNGIDGGWHCSLCSQGPYHANACTLLKNVRNKPRLPVWTKMFKKQFLDIGMMHICRLCRYWMAKWGWEADETSFPDVWYAGELKKLYPSLELGVIPFSGSSFMGNNQPAYALHRLVDHRTPELQELQDACEKAIREEHYRKTGIRPRRSGQDL